jgi:hypothetical protein
MRPAGRGDPGRPAGRAAARRDDSGGTGPSGLAEPPQWRRQPRLVVEGDAVPVTDDHVLRRLAEAWRAKWDGRWQYQVRDGAFRHPASEEPVLVFAVTPAKILAFTKGDFSHTRHRF